MLIMAGKGMRLHTSVLSPSCWLDRVEDLQPSYRDSVLSIFHLFWWILVIQNLIYIRIKIFIRCQVTHTELKMTDDKSEHCIDWKKLEVKRPSKY